MEGERYEEIALAHFGLLCVGAKAVPLPAAWVGDGNYFGFSKNCSPLLYVVSRCDADLRVLACLANILRSCCRAASISRF